MYDYFLAEFVEKNEVPITQQHASPDVIHLSCFLLVKIPWEHGAQNRKNSDASWTWVESAF